MSYVSAEMWKREVARAERAEAEVARLRAALEPYRYCRHACQECSCTVEARAALAQGGGGQ